MKTNVLGALAIAACASGCFGAQYIDMIAHAGSKSDPDDGADAWCKEHHNDDRSPNAAMCFAVFAHTAKHSESLPPALRDAIAFYATSDGYDRVEGDGLAPAYVMASELDLGAVDAAMKDAGVDSRLAEAFARHLRVYGKKVVADGDANGPGWKAVFVTPALEAGAAWDAGIARRAPWRAKAAALVERADRVAIEHGKDAKLAGEVLALRRAYVDDCRRASVAIEECLGDEVSRPLTKHLVQLALDAGDSEGATAAKALLDVPDVSTRGFAVHDAVAAAMAKGKEERAAWEKAKGEGRSESALRAKWPSTPPVVDDTVDVPGESPPAPLDGVDVGDHGFSSSSRATVAGVTRKGPRAVITFVRDVEDQASQGDCRETNKVDSIDEQGNIHYREVCGPDVMERVDMTEAPVTVPVEEATSLRAGEILTFVADDHHRGHVIEVNEHDPRVLQGTLGTDDQVSTPRVQLGEYRLDVARPRATAKAAKKPAR